MALSNVESRVVSASEGDRTGRPKHFLQQKYKETVRLNIFKILALIQHLQQKQHGVIISSPLAHNKNTCSARMNSHPECLNTFLVCGAGCNLDCNTSLLNRMTLSSAF